MILDEIELPQHLLVTFVMIDPAKGTHELSYLEVNIMIQEHHLGIMRAVELTRAMKSGQPMRQMYAVGSNWN